MGAPHVRWTDTLTHFVPAPVIARVRSIPSRVLDLVMDPLTLGASLARVIALILCVQATRLVNRVLQVAEVLIASYAVAPSPEMGALLVEIAKVLFMAATAIVGGAAFALLSRTKATDASAALMGGVMMAPMAGMAAGAMDLTTWNTYGAAIPGVAPAPTEPIAHTNPTGDTDEQ